MTAFAETTSKYRLSASLATVVALACLVAPDGLGSPVLGLFLFGGAAFVLLGFVGLDLVGAVLPGGRVGVRRLRRVAALIMSAPLLLLAVLILGFQSPAAMPLVLPGGLVFAAVAVFAVDRLAPRLGAPDDPRFWLGTAVAAAQLTALFLYVHVSEDTFAVVRPGTERLHAVLYFGTWAASLALLLPWGARIASRTGAAAPSRWWGAWSGLAALVGLGALFADRRFMVGLYPAVHVWLQFVGVLSLDAALSRGLARAQLERWHTAPRTVDRLQRLGAGALGLVVVAAAGFAVAAFGGLAGDRGFRAQVGETAIGPTLLKLARSEARVRGNLRDLDYPLHHDVAAPPNDWNIVLISVDALRADALPDPENPDKSAAPRLSALASTCADFRRTYAPGSRTAIGMGALMLGRYSANIQWNLWIWDGKLINPKTATAKDIRGLSNGVQYTTIPEIPPEGNLAQRMKGAGLSTLATPWDGYSRFFRKDAGFDPGFEDYTDFNGKSWREPASPKVLPIALEQIDKHKDKRFFQWVHLFDPHESDSDREKYAELVKSMDEAIGEFLDGLEERGLRDKTAIFLVADHGEALGDHRNATHGTSLFEEQVRVPMLMCLPGGKGQVFRQPVSTLDAAATMLKIAGADLTGIDGVNLLPLIEQGTYPAERPVFTELHRYMSAQAQRTTDMQAVILGDWKLIRDLKNDTAQLFNLAADPKEEQSVLGGRSDVADDLEDLLDALNAARAKPRPPQPLFATKPAAFDVTGDSVLLWTRATLPATLHFEIATNAKFTKITTETPPVDVTDDTDMVHVADVGGLSPGTRYWYRPILTFEGERTVGDTGAFTTSAAKPKAIKLAWSADLMAENEPFQIFGPLKRERPEVFLMLGDTMYADIPKKKKAKDLKGYRGRHKLVRRDEALQNFLASTATAATWDDHEIANNAHSGTANLAAARQAFREQWPLRSADPDDVGLYRSFRPAPQVEVFMLDLRSFRDPPKSRSSMLGEAQKEWLITGIKSSPAKTKIVVSSVPMFAPFGEDSWNGFPGERDELRTVLASEPPGSVIVLSGDYHLAWHLVDPETGLNELVAGPLDAWTFEEMLPQHAGDVSKRGGFAMTDGPNFGVLDIAADGSVTARYVDAKGKQKYRVVLSGPPEGSAASVAASAAEPSAAPKRAATSSTSADTAPKR